MRGRPLERTGDHSNAQVHLISLSLPAPARRAPQPSWQSAEVLTACIHDVDLLATKACPRLAVSRPPFSPCRAPLHLTQHLSLPQQAMLTRARTRLATRNASTCLVSDVARFACGTGGR